MRQLLGAVAVGIGLAAAAAAQGAPAVELRNVAAQVVVTPEPRNDIKVEVVRPSARLPLRIGSFAGRTYIDGGLGRRIRGCDSHGGQPSVVIAGLGETPLGALPEVIIHTPTDVRVFASGAVWG